MTIVSDTPPDNHESEEAQQDGDDCWSSGVAHLFSPFLFLLFRTFANTPRTCFCEKSDSVVYIGVVFQLRRVCAGLASLFAIDFLHA